MLVISFYREGHAFKLPIYVVTSLNVNDTRSMNLDIPQPKNCGTVNSMARRCGFPVNKFSNQAKSESFHCLICFDVRRSPVTCKSGAHPVAWWPAGLKNRGATPCGR